MKSEGCQNKACVGSTERLFKQIFITIRYQWRQPGIRTVLHCLSIYLRSKKNIKI